MNGASRSLRCMGLLALLCPIVAICACSGDDSPPREAESSRRSEGLRTARWLDSSGTVGLLPSGTLALVDEDQRTGRDDPDDDAERAAVDSQEENDDDSSVSVLGRAERSGKRDDDEDDEDEAEGGDDDDDERDDDDDDNDDEDDDDDDDAAIRLSPDQRREFDIEVSVAAPAQIREVIELTGEIEANANQTSRLTPRFEGIVRELHGFEGEYVERGKLLARIESNETLEMFELRAPIAGTIVERNATLGESVGIERPAFVIIDLSTVWVELDVPQKHVIRTRIGQEVVVSTPDIASEEGILSYIAPMLSEDTRTARARIVLANPTGMWRPGQFVNGSIAVGELAARVGIPVDAVQRLNDRQIVFVDESDGLRARDVELGKSDGRTVEIVAGLEVGERFVSEGAFLLKSELQKAAFQDDDD